MDTLQNRLEKFLKVYGITMQYFEQQCNIGFRKQRINIFKSIVRRKR